MIMNSQGEPGKPVTYPFGAYDIFGYIIPGATVIFAALNFEYWYNQSLGMGAITPFLFTFVQPLHQLPSQNLIYASLYAAGLLSMVYVSGHAVSSLSSLFLDRIYVAKALGYPFETLLRLPRSSGFRRVDSMGFYKGMFFWLNLYLLARFLGLLYWGDRILLSVRLVSEVLIVAAVAAKLGSGLLRRHPSWMVCRIFRTTRMRKIVVNPTKYFLSAVFPGFYLLAVNGIESYLRTNREFEPEMRERYSRHFQEIFKMDARRAGTDNFWLTKMFISMKSPSFDRTLTYWLNMYTFSRNLAAAFYVSFLYCLWFIDLQYSKPVVMTQQQMFVVSSIPLAYFGLAFVLMARFRYIYVGYFNRFLFRSFIFLNEVR
jgi:hypothetical protein